MPADTRDPMEIAEERIAEAKRTGWKILYLSGLNLTSVPESIATVQHVVGLYLNSNRLRTVPEGLGRLQNLVGLYLQQNELVELPESLRLLTGLQKLVLDGNPELGLPVEYQNAAVLYSARDSQRTPGAILDYYFRVVRGSRPLHEAKVILVGRGEVGKTSLVKRLVHDQFDPTESITHGINITRYPIQLGEDAITLHVWDFGGQEIMHGTHQFFLTERSMYLLVLNGRAGDARQEAEYWMQMIRSYGGDSPVLVVLNKQGQHPFDVDREALTQRFPQIKGFVRTDCKDATGIDELKAAIAREVGELPNLRAKFPKAWFAIKDRLSGMSENYIGFEKFGTICDELGEKDPQGQESLAAVLHVLGIALNYRDDPRLTDTHVLNPQWVTSGIYGVVTAPLVAKQHGILNPGDLAKILDAKGYPRTMHRFLTDLMRKFDVCFAVPDDSGKLLVPNLLDVAEPKGVPILDPAKSLNFEYRYVVLPEGILPRFIARTHWYSEGQPRWRTGVVLAFDGCEAVVRADTVGRKITIRVSGPPERRRSLLTIIRSEFDRFHTEFKANPPEAWVPLPGFPDVAVKFDELLALEAESEAFHTERINGQRQKFAVAGLLSGLGVVRNADGRKAKRVFISYSHKDETYKAVLVGYLAQMIQEGLIHWWDDRHLRPADDWAGDIDRNLNSADIILLLTSKHFLASKYCMEIEVPRALERRDTEGARVVPIFLDDSKPWEQAFAKTQGLPTDAKPILSAAHWPDPNDAWRQVADKLRALVSA